MNLGNTTIIRGHAIQDLSGTTGISRYYDIQPEMNSQLNATLVFHYAESELEGLDEHDLHLYRSADMGKTWTAEGGVVNPEANTVTLSGIDALSIWTLGGNTFPAFTSDPETDATQDASYNYLAAAEDPDGDTVTISASTLPPWLTLTEQENGEALLAGTPDNSHVGENPIVLNASDGRDTVRQSFTIVVANINDPPGQPVIVSPQSGDTINIVGDLSGILVVDWEAATDIDGDQLTYTWQLSADEDFGILLALEATETTTEYSTDMESLVTILTNNEISLDEPVILFHRVIASDGEFDTGSETALLTFIRETATGIEDAKGIPNQFILMQNYPNPFHASTQIMYALPKPDKVEIAVYDLLGRKIATLVDSHKPPGWHFVEWDAPQMKKGVYLYSISTQQFSQIKPMILMK